MNSDFAIDYATLDKQVVTHRYQLSIDNPVLESGCGTFKTFN